MKSKVNFNANKQHTDFLKKINIDKKNLKESKRIIWDNYINNDIPATFASRIQEIDDINRFNEETQQLFAFLVNSNNEFENLKNLKKDETFEIISFMSPGQDKPSHLVKWDKCLIASICCGTAPTQEQYNDPSYNQIIFSLIKNKIIPLVYLLYKFIEDKGLTNFKIIKNSKESNIKNVKKNCYFYVHTLSFIKITDDIIINNEKTPTFIKEKKIINNNNYNLYIRECYDNLIMELADINYKKCLFENYIDHINIELENINNKLLTL